ncbi:Uma2 family endonuclease [Streptomyces sp. enrichment culture]|uniref:Uma2 family endonuclease n=1 Tax=Streptomyces sp. enrichment culture TaxID=1795815 RepID=UPI003F54D32C
MACETPPSDWPVPPDDGWTADDLDRLPGLPQHTQLIDAGLVFPCPQSAFHERATSFFGRQLTTSAAPGLDVLCRFSVDVDRQNRLEADVIVLQEAALMCPEQTRVPAAAVVLVVEVTSPDSVSRDRETKPLKYARAGIAHYWRVENEKGLAVVHAFELEPTTRAYTSVGIFRERMKVSAPFPMDLDLTGIRPRRGGE